MRSSSLPEALIRNVFEEKRPNCQRAQLIPSECRVIKPHRKQILLQWLAMTRDPHISHSSDSLSSASRSRRRRPHVVPKGPGQDERGLEPFRVMGVRPQNRPEDVCLDPAREFPEGAGSRIFLEQTGGSRRRRAGGCAGRVRPRWCGPARTPHIHRGPVIPEGVPSGTGRSKICSPIWDLPSSFVARPVRTIPPLSDWSKPDLRISARTSWQTSSSWPVRPRPGAGGP